MKRLRVDETVKEGSEPPLSGSGISQGGALYHQSLPNVVTGPLSYSNTPGSTVKVVSEGMQSGLYPPTPPVSYGHPLPAATTPHSLKPPAMSIPVGGHSQLRTAGGSPSGAGMQESAQQQSPSTTNFQRLKVEDALSYLDLVKFKFGAKPQVYNDFLDIMKEFKSQTIDTPGVITRVSNLFKGFPELIVGFNTFLPPGYKIEVQRNDQGYAFQVSVSMPSPTGSINSGSQEHRSAMILKGSGTINVSGQQAPSTQPLTITQHMTPVTPQAPQQPQQPPIVHHTPPYGGNAAPPLSYGSLTLSAAQAAVTHALQGRTDTPQNQPVEFNHAITYVNKIKVRYYGEMEEKPKKRKSYGRMTDVAKKLRLCSHELGPDCKCKRLNCFVNVSDENKLRILRDFNNNYSTYDEQNTYLAGLITVVPVKRRRAKNPESGVKKFNDASYSFRVRCTDASRSSRYSNLKTSKTYLPEELNITKMYSMFKKKFPHTNISYDSYKKVFNEKYNISFGYPRSDTCSQCDEMNSQLKTLQSKIKISTEDNELNSLNVQFRRLEFDRQLHLTKAETFYQRKRQAKLSARADVAVEAICMDFAKNLPIPNISTNDVYYSRQLSLYLFNVHVLSSQQSVYFGYPETVGQKGSNNSRFQGQPEKYKKFLEILHTYQKEQRTLKESSSIGSSLKHLTEQEVYSQVAKLFENQSDLLTEFGQFLPDATSHISQAPVSEHNSVKKLPAKPYHRDHMPERHGVHHKPSHISGSTVKRSPPYSTYQHRDAPPPKKHKISQTCRDVSLSEAGKYGTLNDYAFFDKVLIVICVT
ncbi:unnamed protein product [Diabrotica balteata]|uniref:Histone deacetylase interacting domain-containing protein n=1 Tax=Diabrotica balteata TaxID=107213 RepID=A0A9N9SVU3_DIABA|nr:unnamed protein product [Diabrotica balteata]